MKPFHLIFGFFAGLLSANFMKVVEKEPSVPEGFIKYSFKCWLCSGSTLFAAKTFTEQKHYQIDCCRCGYENKVSVAPKVKT